MSKESDGEEGLVNFEMPKITLNLGKALGWFLPIDLEIPLPKIRNPFSAVRSRPLSLPFKRLEMRFRAWWDALGAIPTYDGKTIAAIEMEVEGAASQKIRNVEFALAPRKLEIDQALNRLRPIQIKAEVAAEAAKHQCIAALAAFSDRKRRVDEWHKRCETRVADARKALSDFVREKQLRSEKPYWVLQRWKNIAIVLGLFVLDLTMSAPLVKSGELYNWTDAVLIGISFSLMNCILGLAGGQTVAHLYFRDLSERFRKLQIALLATWVLGGVLINALFATVRDHTQENAAAMSAALVIVGLSLFAIFAIKGFRDFADVHSGHLDLWTDLQSALRRLGQANSARASLQDRARDTSAELLQQVREGVDKYMSSIARTRTGAADCRSALEAQRDLVPSLGRGFEETAHTLIALYRERNEYWRRKKEAIPAARPVRTFEQPNYDITREIAKVEAFEQILDQNENEIREFARLFETYVQSILLPKDPPPSPDDGSRTRSPTPPTRPRDGSEHTTTLIKSSNGVTAWPHEP